MKKIRVLNRAIFIILFGVHFLQLYGQIDTEILQKQWISVDNRYTDKSDGWYIQEANILNFTENQIEGYYAWDDSLFIFSIEENDSLIICNDTLNYGKILFLSTDSLLISINQGKMIVTYIPIMDVGKSISKQLLDTILTKKAWIKTYPYGEMRIDFWNLEAGTPMIKYCHVIVEQKYNYYRDGGYWSTFYYKGNSFLYLSIDPTSIYESGIFQIVEIDSSEIKTQTLSIRESEYVSFIGIENLSNIEFTRLKSILTSKEWQIDSIQEMSDFYNLSEEELDEMIVPVTRTRKDKWITKEDFHKNVVIYKFDTSGVYTLTMNNIDVETGTWSLSRDGKYLYLHNKRTGGNLLKILTYDSEQIQIRQKIYLKVSEETHEIKGYDYIMKLN